MPRFDIDMVITVGHIDWGYFIREEELVFIRIFVITFHSSQNLSLLHVNPVPTASCFNF